MNAYLLIGFGSTYNKLTLVDVESKRIIHKENLPPKGIYCVAFSPDGRWLVTGAADKRLRIWELRLD